MPSHRVAPVTMARIAFLDTISESFENNCRTATAGKLFQRCVAKSCSDRDHLFQISVSLPLYGDAGGIADLDPNRTSTRSICAIDLLRHEVLGAKPAGMREDDRAVLGNVFIG